MSTNNTTPEEKIPDNPLGLEIDCVNGYQDKDGNVLRCTCNKECEYKRLNKNRGPLTN